MQQILFNHNSKVVPMGTDSPSHNDDVGIWNGIFATTVQTLLYEKQQMQNKPNLLVMAQNTQLSTYRNEYSHTSKNE